MTRSALLPLPEPKSLSLPELVAQLIVVRASGHLFDPEIRYPAWEPPAAMLQAWIQDLGVGGVILLGGSAAEIALKTQQLQDWAAIPLLIAADIEEGVGQRFSGATWFPPAMALGAIAQTDLDMAQSYAEQMGAVTAREALALGLNWILAPVVDVNNNPANPVINVRAFGETPEIVSQLSTAFIRGTQRYSVLTAAKHFPGHGDTAIDSHLELPILQHSRERLAQIEFPPFQQAIATGVDAVMSAHVLIPALDPDFPATLSPRLLTQELRQHLGFEGLIVTDALIMGAIAKRYGIEEAAVLAISAGADIVLMPADPPRAIQAICTAVTTGRIAPERILASVERVWRAKAKVATPLPSNSQSTHAREQIMPPLIQLDQIAQPTSLQLVDRILQRSQQVYTPTCLAMPEGSQQYCNLILVDDLLNCNFLGRHTPAIVLPKQWGYQLQVVDSNTPETLLPLGNNAKGQLPPLTLLQVFIRGNPFRGSTGLTQRATAWLQFLIQTQQLQALAVYGSPYILEQFCANLPPEIPYVFSYGQNPVAQGIALRSLFAIAADAPALDWSRFE